MSIEEAYKNDAIRLCSANPLYVLERLCPELSRSGFAASDIEVRVDLDPDVRWTAYALVSSAGHVEKVNSEFLWMNLRDLFRKHELKAVLLNNNVKRRVWTERGKHFYGGTEVKFKVQVSPEMDLNVSFL